ncbi:hypothetical protein [Oceanicoccus sagamiensis]|uniref:Uncharacterized protein n=1 Tax=Oceanicoccus sagamiensis TaxID=716816 RepID=A0A1X9N8X2_9GAMM|nr:hypothetical protein [Oceanicoccus sagamiensis]ARN73534.1 hypothetical protein BST96_05005 [Oceanicoccus sagamiensis]
MSIEEKSNQVYRSIMIARIYGTCLFFVSFIMLVFVFYMSWFYGEGVSSDYQERPTFWGLLNVVALGLFAYVSVWIFKNEDKLIAKCPRCSGKKEARRTGTDQIGKGAS